MTIASEITKLQSNLTESYAKAEEKGATIPTAKNFDNLPATIESITGGGGGSKYGQTIDNIYGDVNTSGVLQNPITAPINFKGVKNIASYVLRHKFYFGIQIPTQIIMDDLTLLSNSDSLYAMCQQNKTNNFTFSAKNLKTISGSNVIEYTFQASYLTSIDLSGVENVTGSNAMRYMASNCQKLTDIRFGDNLTSLSGSYCAQQAFYYAPYTGEIHLDKLKTLGNYALSQFLQYSRIRKFSANALEQVTKNYALQSALQACSFLEDAEFNSLKKITGSYALQSLFSTDAGYTKAEPFPALEEINGSNCLNQTFRETGQTELIFRNLKKILGTTPMYYMCYNNKNLKKVYFYALEQVSNTAFGNGNYQWAWYGCTNVEEIHFPAGVQSQIEATAGYSTKWGATNASILFDL